MHDSRYAMQTFAWVWLGGVAVLVLWLLGTCMFGNAQQRERGRNDAAKLLGGDGWVLLSLTLKFVGHAVPRLDHHVPWLWIPPLVIGVLSWTLRGARWMAKRRARMRPAQSAYTRSLRKTGLRERSLIRRR